MDLRAVIDVLVTPNVGELAARYINIAGVVKKRHSRQESTVLVEVMAEQSLIDRAIDCQPAKHCQTKLERDCSHRLSLRLYRSLPFVLYLPEFPLSQSVLEFLLFLRPATK